MYVSIYVCMSPYNYMYIYIVLVNPLPGVETNVYLVCRFTGWMVGQRDDLHVCRLAKLEGCMEMNISSPK